MGAFGRMLLHPANLLDSPMRNREIDLPGGGAGLLWRETDSAEKGLRHTVMPLVFGEASRSLGRESGLSPVPGDQAVCLEYRQVL